ncbi:hypothetical protein QJS66_21110 [Kocuria rhizophila]|nr:hypothetical protein QJS66_21110 [Kocuria rhizophila]
MTSRGPSSGIRQALDGLDLQVTLGTGVLGGRGAPRRQAGDRGAAARRHGMGCR